MNSKPSTTSIENFTGGDLQKIKSFRYKFPKNVIVSYLNINSIRNKLTNLDRLIGNYVDILSIGETKIDKSFPTSQFQLAIFKAPYRLDMSCTSGGLMTFVRKDITSRQLTDFKFPSDIQILPVELNFKKSKWLLFNIYRNPTGQSLTYFLECLSEAIIFYSQYDSILITGDFNAEPNDPEISNFLLSNQLHNHMKEKTCWKSTKGSCIDLFLSNKKYSLMNTGTVETGISDYHSLIYSMLKMTYEKLPPRIVKYRQWKRFNKDFFKFELSSYLQYNTFVNKTDYSNFEKAFETILERHAPLKTKFLRGNHQPHVTKDLRKAIMLRSKLKNKANKTKKLEDYCQYKRQRNLVVNLNRSSKQSFFANTRNSPKNFWKAVKPYFGGKKSIDRERIVLVESDAIISDEKILASTFNSFFNSATESLRIPEIPGVIVTSEDPVLAAIEKFSQHPSVLTIKNRRADGNLFELEKISTDTMIKEIVTLNPKKTVSGTIPIKALKVAAVECADTLPAFSTSMLLNRRFFQMNSKLLKLYQHIRKIRQRINPITDPSVYYQ